MVLAPFLDTNKFLGIFVPASPFRQFSGLFSGVKEIFLHIVPFLWQHYPFFPPFHPKYCSFLGSAGIKLRFFGTVSGHGLLKFF